MVYILKSGKKFLALPTFVMAIIKSPANIKWDWNAIHKYWNVLKQIINNSDLSSSLRQAQ